MIINAIHFYDISQFCHWQRFLISIKITSLLKCIPNSTALSNDHDIFGIARITIPAAHHATKLSYHSGYQQVNDLLWLIYSAEDVMIHEASHAAHLLGAKYALPDFDSRLMALYNNAKSTGLWKNTYAMSTEREYFVSVRVSISHAFPQSRCVHRSLRCVELHVVWLIWFSSWYSSTIKRIEFACDVCDLDSGSGERKWLSDMKCKAM